MEKKPKKDEIFIVGPREFQNELIAAQIEKELGHRCALKPVLQIKEEKNQPSMGSKMLHLIDFGGMRSTDMSSFSSTDKFHSYKDTYQALFNVNAQLGEEIEFKAYTYGYQGLFFENQSQDLFLKGIRTILDGKYWFSRTAMNRILKQAGASLILPKNTQGITKREKEILDLICKGHLNEEIADRLCISIHTVKNHISNLYDKLDVPNRLQAVLWAVNHKDSI
jgi:DNA-binding NarL/FixJ family response regulator